jgi:hypothetical protein
MKVRDIVGEPWGTDWPAMRPPAKRERAIAMVGLLPDMADRYPLSSPASASASASPARWR